jgi:hypothetical protein
MGDNNMEHTNSDQSNDIHNLQQEIINLREILSGNKVEQENRAKKNYNFTQFYRSSFKEFRALVRSNSTAVEILMIIVEKMNKQNALVISQKTLTKITGKTRQTISKAVKTLEKKHFIQIIKVGTANAYVVNSNVFWQSDADKKDQYAIFTATVVANSAEQENHGENWKGVKLKSLPLMYKNEIPTINNVDKDI